MIAYLKGEVLDVSLDSILVFTPSGVGYNVYLTGRELDMIHSGDTVAVYTYLSVKEDSLNLYGFLQATDKKMFELFLKVSGIGPKVALSIIGSLKHDEIALALKEGNVDSFTKVPGIGKKTAQRIILELKDKLPAETFVLPTLAKANTETEELKEILLALGYLPKEAASAAEAVYSLPENKEQPADKLLPQALQYLSNL